MPRREAKNVTGITRLKDIPYHDAWVGFSCVKCGHRNVLKIGLELLTPDGAYENSRWKCEKCGYVHSKESNLPREFKNWEEKYREADSLTAKRFWQGFFRIATERPDSYWKQCNVCRRVLPQTAFDKHFGWGPLERQMECRGCKAAINAKLNPLRTKEQLHESSLKRRVADLLLEGESEKISHEDIFRMFDSKCFKTGANLDIKNRSTWEIDHILPSKYLYPLTKNNACLLSADANGNKAEKWPSEFYTNGELVKLAKITGANIKLLSSKKPIINTSINVNASVTRYLNTRERSNLEKRVDELKKLLEDYNLVDKLSINNKRMLGYIN
jgi:Uncharacterized protein conserved in bacteria